MTRPLRTIDVSSSAAGPREALQVQRALRAALSGEGPAVLPAAAPPAPRVEPVETASRVEPVETASRVEPVETQVPKRVALVIETSGSTGTPKRVALSTDALLASAAASSAALGGAGQWLLALPTHYIAGAQVLVRSIVAGTDPVLMPGGHFDPLAFAQHAQQLEAPLRFVSLVPVQLARVVAAAEQDAFVHTAAQRFDRILVGGQATPPALIARAEALGLRVTRTYGSSETAGGCVYDGVPLRGTTIRIEGGLIELGGPTLAEGYLNADGTIDAQRTAAAFAEEHGTRWYRTGDLGEYTNGLVHVLGRSDNVIITGGEKVSLEAVERVLHALPGCESAVAVAIADPTWGQAIVVVLDERADAAGDSAANERALSQMRDAVASALGMAARPRALHVVTAVPRLPSGKIDRIELASVVAKRR